MYIVLTIILLFVVFSLRNKIERLEERLTKLEGGEVNSLSTPKVSFGGQATAQIKKVSEKITMPIHTVSKKVSMIGRFFSWLKEDFMVKLGALLLLLALGWFVSYAFINDWVGPAGRILIGILFGVLVLVLGTWRIQKYRHQGGIFISLGATIMLLTIFAAREIYDFFTPVSALIMMFATVVFVAFVSIRYQSEKLALAGLVLAGIAPLLTSSPVEDPLVIFSYLLVVTIGSLWVVWNTGWTKLTFMALVVTYLHSFPFLGRGLFGYDQDVVLVFSFLFVAIFFVANLVSLVRRREDSKHIGVHAATALGTAVFLFSWIEVATVEEWRSLLYSAWALVFAVGTYVVFVATANYKAFYLYGATAIALLGVATASELEGSVLVIAYILEISLLLVATSRITKQDKILAYQSLLFIIPAMLSVESIDSRNWIDSVLHEDFAVLSLMMIALGISGMALYFRKSEATKNLTALIRGALFFGSGFYFLILVWLVNNALFSDDTATMFSLVIYTLIGLGFFIHGRVKDFLTTKIIGGILIGLVVARLLLVEVWGMGLEGKIITFLVIGGLLISTAFIKKATLDTAVNNPENNGINK